MEEQELELARISPTYKLVVVGQSGVGKSSLLLRYTDKKFDQYCTATMGMDFKTRNIERNGNKFKVQIWDTAGQERFSPFVSTVALQHVQVFIYVFALDEPLNERHVAEWVNQIDEDILMRKILVGNKSDLIDQCQVTSQQISGLISAHGFDYFETSAKDGSGVEELFENIMEQLTQEEDMYVDVSNEEYFTFKNNKKKKKKKRKCGCFSKKYAEV